MKHEIAQQWVAALRSGDYVQAKSVLYNGTGHCCLGVLCRVVGSDFAHVEQEREDYEENVIAAYMSEDYYPTLAPYDYESLPREIANMVEIKNEDGHPREDGAVIINGAEYRSLAEANDKGASFAEIADWIEQNWERL